MSSASYMSFSTLIKRESDVFVSIEEFGDGVNVCVYLPFLTVPTQTPFFYAAYLTLLYVCMYVLYVLHDRRAVSS